MQSLEHSENFFSIFLIKANAIILHENAAELFITTPHYNAIFGKDFDFRADIRFAVLQCIADQIVKQHPHQPRVNFK